MKKWICGAAMLLAMGASAGAYAAGATVTIDSVSVTDAGLSVSLYGEAQEGVTVFAAEYVGDLLSRVAVQKIEVTEDLQSVELAGIGANAVIYVWDEAQTPLCDVYPVSDAVPTPDITAEPDTTDVPDSTSEPDSTDMPDSTSEPDATDEPVGDGIIHLMEDSIVADGVENVIVDGTTVTITAAGEYEIDGTLTDGQIVVASAAKSDIVTLKLDGVSVTNSTLAPFSATKGKVELLLKGENTFTDTLTDGTVTRDNGCITSKHDLTIKPQDGESGKLVVNGNYENGIRCKNDLEIGGVDVTVNAVKTGIKGDESVKFTKKAGTITVNSGADAIKTDSTVLETDETTGEITYSGGEITINGGELNLTASTYTDPATGEVSEGDGIQTDHILTIANSPKINITAAGDGMQAGIREEVVSGNTTEEIVTVPGEINISGGTVNLIQSGDDGIVSRGSVAITGGTITGSAAADFFKVYDLFEMSDGTLDIVAGNDGIQSGKALTETVSGSTTTESNYTSGNINISGGSITIRTNGGSLADPDTVSYSCKGIKANTELNITGGVLNYTGTDDAVHSNYNVTVTGGEMTLATGDDGIHADYMLTLGTEGGADEDFRINITESYEGIEGSVIKLLSGTTYLVSSDDGVNAAGDYAEDGTLSAQSEDVSAMAGPGGMGGNPGGGTGGGGPQWGGDDSAAHGMLYIKGGRTYCVVNGDGLDSNGSIEMSGGTVIVNGPTSGGNGVFDKGDGSGDKFSVTGGILIGAGSSDMQDNPTVTGQGYLQTSGSSGGRPGMGGSGSSISLTKGVPITITTSGESIVFVPEITLSNALLYVTCPQMASGGSFSAAANSGSISGGTEILLKDNTYGAVFASN